MIYITICVVTITSVWSAFHSTKISFFWRVVSFSSPLWRVEVSVLAGVVVPSAFHVFLCWNFRANIVWARKALILWSTVPPKLFWMSFLSTCTSSNSVTASPREIYVAKVVSESIVCPRDWVFSNTHLQVLRASISASANMRVTCWLSCILDMTEAMSFTSFDEREILVKCCDDFAWVAETRLPMTVEKTWVETFALERSTSARLWLSETLCQRSPSWGMIELETRTFLRIC